MRVLAFFDCVCWISDCCVGEDSNRFVGVSRAVTKYDTFLYHNAEASSLQSRAMCLFQHLGKLAQQRHVSSNECQPACIAFLTIMLHFKSTALHDRWGRWRAGCAEPAAAPSTTSANGRVAVLS